jgi:hypothetical protein
LILDNEESYYNDLRTMAGHYDEDEVYDFEQEVKEYVESLIPDEYYDYSHNPILSALLRTAIAYIDFREIAEDYIRRANEG